MFRCDDQLASGEQFTPQPQRDGGNRNQNQAADRQIRSVVGRRDCRFIEYLRVLGMTLSSKLTFDDHVSELVQACRNTRTLRHNRPPITQEMVNVITCSVVCSRLYYLTRLCKATRFRRLAVYSACLTLCLALSVVLGIDLQPLTIADHFSGFDRCKNYF